MIGHSIPAVVLSSVTLFAVACAHGAELTVETTDLRGPPVPDAAVTAVGPDEAGRAGPATGGGGSDGLAFVLAVLRNVLNAKGYAGYAVNYQQREAATTTGSPRGSDR